MTLDWDRLDEYGRPRFAESRDSGPECPHGYVMPNCPYEDCCTQIGYLDRFDAELRAFYRKQKEEALVFVRDLLRYGP